MHEPLRTTDPEVAEEALRESHQLDGGVRDARVGERSSFAHEVLGGSGFAATRFQTSATVDYGGPHDGLLAVGQVHAGRITFTTATTELRIESGGIGLVPPHESWRAVSADVDRATLLLDRDRVADHAAGLAGIAPDSLTFTDLRPVSAAAASLWAATVAHVRDHVLSVPEVAAAPLLQAEAFRTLATRLLVVFPNTAIAALQAPARPDHDRAEPASVRRAVEFIETHAARPITLADIAEVARLGARGLQAAFRRHRGQTPLEYLRQVRLDRAHRDLRAADPTRGDTVAAIAARWGFTHPGRFSVQYRQAYGRSPNNTLRAWEHHVPA